jgi:hypothetical protein
MSTRPILEETLINTPRQNFKTAEAINHEIKFLKAMMLIKFLTLF